MMQRRSLHAARCNIVRCTLHDATLFVACCTGHTHRLRSFVDCRGRDPPTSAPGLAWPTSAPGPQEVGSLFGSMGRTKSGEEPKDEKKKRIGFPRPYPLLRPSLLRSPFVSPYARAVKLICISVRACVRACVCVCMPVRVSVCVCLSVWV